MPDPIPEEQQPAAQEELTPREIANAEYAEKYGPPEEPEATPVPEGVPPPQSVEEPAADPAPEGEPPPESGNEPEAIPAPEGDLQPENAEDASNGDVSNETKIRFQERAKRRTLEAKHAEEMAAIKREYAPKEPEAVIQPDVPETFDDIDMTLNGAIKEINSLKSTMASMQASNTQTAEYNEAVRVQKQAADNARLVTELGEELNADGYPGFKMFVGEINTHLQGLNDADYAKLNNPEGFKTIYRETVYPKVQRVFNNSHNQDVLKTRNARKENGLGIATTQAVGSNAKPDDGDNWSPQKYLTEIRGIPQE